MLPTMRLFINSRFAAVRNFCAMTLLVLYVPVAMAAMYEDFIFAIANDRVPQVKELLAKGIDPNTVDPSGEPVLVAAARAGYTATVDALLAAKANVNARSVVGDTAIMTAALNGHLDLVKKLRLRGADIAGTGWTPLIYASTGGHDAVVSYLLAEGANVNAVSPNGTSALMMAAREGRTSTVKLLLTRGANAAHRNQHDASALTWALRGNEQDMAATLRRAGAKE
jgi:ankyrin repeat protein